MISMLFIWLVLVVTVLATPVPSFAERWHCQSPLSITADPGKTASAMQYDLQVGPDGTFAASGAETIRGETYRFEWSGSWILDGDSFFMIGEKAYELRPQKNHSEMRGRANLHAPDAMIFSLLDDGYGIGPVRCLPDGHLPRN